LGFDVVVEPAFVPGLVCAVPVSEFGPVCSGAFQDLPSYARSGVANEPHDEPVVDSQ
jgi:hypothetical protein